MDKHLPVKAVMTPCPISTDENTSPEEAMRLMGLHGLRHLPVTRDGELVGIVTERDVQVSFVLCESTGVCQTGVGAIGMKEPLMVSEETTVSDVAQMMADQKQNCALVADEEGNFVGVFTTTDACRILHLVLGDSDSSPE